MLNFLNYWCSWNQILINVKNKVLINFKQILHNECTGATDYTVLLNNGIRYHWNIAYLCRAFNHVKCSNKSYKHKRQQINCFDGQTKL